METIDALLARHTFFQGMNQEYLELIAGCARNVHFAADQYILREDENADEFYAIRAGSVAVEVHAPQRGVVTLQTVGAGEILGWSWLFPPYKWQFDARARGSVSATAFDAACLRNKCDNDPALGYELMKRLARIVTSRLEATRFQLMDIYGPGSAG